MRGLGILFVILAAIGWGLSGGIGDILMERGWDPIVISFYRGAIGLVFFLIWLVISSSSKSERSGRFYLWAVLAGLGVAGNFTLYYTSIEASSVPVAATLMYTAPVFVLLISFVLRIEKSTIFKWSCVASVVAGIVLLTGAYNPDDVAVSALGVITGLGAGLAYTLFIFGFKRASKLGNPETILAVAFSAFCIALFLLADPGQLLAVWTSADIGWFILLGTVGAGVSFIFYLYGIRKTAPSTASMVAMVEPVTATLFGLLLLGDVLTLIQAVGMGVILITVTILSVKQA
ncbi:DMT family transporter [Alkalicoccus luteus]|uniref:DMT family transporter n=1 Tax=Alkalicoccus luteus TaxID=1237094 RepID=UPI00403359D4